MAASYNSRGLPNSIEFESDSMEIEEDAIKNRRSNSSGSGSQEIFVSRNYRNFTYPEQGLPFQLLHNPRSDKEATNFGLQNDQQLYSSNHFKMEGVPALREVIEQNDYICKIDLKDAYVVVPLHQKSRKYLTFLHQNKVYQYKTLAFGMSVSPRIFSKIMRYVIEPLRKEGIRMTYYLDDICLLAKSKEEMNAINRRVIEHLQNLGFIIKSQKSVLTPLKIQQFLGFQFNTKKMLITVPQEKISKLLKRVDCESFGQDDIYATGNSGRPTTYTTHTKGPVIHIEEQETELGVNMPIIESQQTGTGMVVAMDRGWGVASQELETTGFWTEKEKATSINTRELQAIYFGLKLHARKCQGTTIRVYTDNIIALKYTIKEGGTASPLLQDLAVKIQDLCNFYQLDVQYQHIPGVENVKADQLSRQISTPLYEASVPQHVFRKINQTMGPLKIDAFAARHNRRLQQYWSLRPDPEAINLDAFSQRW
ncbi:hypothetical protein G6F56_008758 [Rhizopus delemar]|nr:hypothetical protein G6F56_008758 [Rhizopus delemar]